MAFTVTKVDPANRITLDQQASYVDVIYDMADRNINTISLKLNFVKDVANLNILAAYKDTRLSADPALPVIADDVWFDETFTDPFGVIQRNNQLIQASGQYRIIYNPLKDEEKVRFRITPTSMAGNDTLVVDINENALGA